MMIRIIGRKQLVSQYLSLVNMRSGMRIAHRQLGARIVIGQDRRLSLQRACTLSWVMVSQTSLFWVMLARSLLGELLPPHTCFLNLFRVRFSLRVWRGEGLSPRAWIGEGLSLRVWTGAGRSLSRPGLGRDHLSLRRDSLLRIGQSHPVSDVLSLNPRYLSMCPLSLRAGSSYPSTPAQSFSK